MGGGERSDGVFRATHGVGCRMAGFYVERVGAAVLSRVYDLGGGCAGAPGGRDARCGCPSCGARAIDAKHWHDPTRLHLAHTRHPPLRCRERIARGRVSPNVGRAAHPPLVVYHADPARQRRRHANGVHHLRDPDGHEGPHGVSPRRVRDTGEPGCSPSPVLPISAAGGRWRAADGDRCADRVSLCVPVHKHGRGQPHRRGVDARLRAGPTGFEPGQRREADGGEHGGGSGSVRVFWVAHDGDAGAACPGGVSGGAPAGVPDDESGGGAAGGERGVGCGVGAGGADVGGEAVAGGAVSDDGTAVVVVVAVSGGGPCWAGEAAGGGPEAGRRAWCVDLRLICVWWDPAAGGVCGECADGHRAGFDGERGGRDEGRSVVRTYN